MGLEFVELLMAVEDEFGIHVPEERWQEVETVRELYDYITDTLISSRPGVCPSMFVFYRMRRALAESLSMDRRSITPDTQFSELLPIRLRRLDWERMRDGLGLSIPDLALPEREARIARKTGTALLWAAVGITLAVAVIVGISAGWLMSVFGLFAGMVIASWVLYPLLKWHTRYERKHATLIPAGHETPRAIISRVVRENEWLIRRESREWLRGNIRERLLHHVREICCYIPGDITLDSRFVDDLKFG